MKRILHIIGSLCFFFAACGWVNPTPEVGVTLSEHFHNKLYSDFDTTDYNPIFRAVLDSLSPKFSNPNIIKSFYESKELDPQLITRFYANRGLDTLTNFLSRSSEHGINPNKFNIEKIRDLLSQLDANKFKNIKDIYPVIANLELLSANSLLKYNIYLRYGLINPTRVLDGYHIDVKRPDSLSMIAVLNTGNIVKLLKDIQPKTPQYLAFQKALLENKNKENERTILVNMERLRWQLPDLGSNFVQVNIPDFSLTWFNDEDTLTHMKVCVGEKREDNYYEKLKVYKKLGRIYDKPKNHETPILVSKFNSIQANPIWNIPRSIAQNEIYAQAVKDRYYLSNSNIAVYYKGKQIDPDGIQWSNYSRANLPFTFKQGSGEHNALGKFKFIFDNPYSIYLHDTNNKSAFSLVNRAISHGCVRIENPLKFAELLVNDSYQYDILRVDVDLKPIDSSRMTLFEKRQARKSDTTRTFILKPTWFEVKKQTPIIINYFTAWYNDGKIEYRKDIYGKDAQVWAAIKRYMN